MPILNDKYIKLQYEDFKVLENLFHEVLTVDEGVLTPEEHIVYGKVQRIIKLMEEKWQSGQKQEGEKVTS